MQELKTSVQSHLATAHNKDMKTVLVECLTIWRSESETERQETKTHFSNLTNFIKMTMVITTSLDQWESYSII